MIDSGVKELGQSKSSNATETYLRSLNPVIWNDLSKLTLREQDDLWFDLTQKHLKDYTKGKSSPEEFAQDENRLMLLNFLWCKNMPRLSPQLTIRGFKTDPGNKHERFGCLGDFTDVIRSKTTEGLKQETKPFKILVSGIGVSGKATIRNVITKDLVETLSERETISFDRDYQKIFPPVVMSDILVVEDVHGLDIKSSQFMGSDCLEGGYDLFVYALSPKPTYKQTLVNRGVGWINRSKIDLTDQQNETPLDLEERVNVTANKLEDLLEENRSFFKEHIHWLLKIKEKSSILVIDPTNLFKELYGFQQIPNLQEKSFLELLEQEMAK